MDEDEETHFTDSRFESHHDRDIAPPEKDEKKYSRSKKKRNANPSLYQRSVTTVGPTV